MASSADSNNNKSPSVPVERNDSTSISSSPARLQGSSRRSGTSVAGSRSSQSAGTETDAPGKGNANEEEADIRQVLECLKEATGFGSYEAYVDSFRQDPMYAGRSYTDILETCFEDHSDVGSGVDIIEVKNEGLLPVGVNIRGVDLSAMEASRVLRDPAPGTAAQIILWPFDDHGSDFESMIDVLGLGLQVDPCFFEPLRWGDFADRFRPKTSLHLSSIGTSVCVRQRYTLAQKNWVPVVLIAGPLHTSLYEFSLKKFQREPEAGHPIRAIYDLVQVAPLYDQLNRASGPHFTNVYIRALSNLLRGGLDTALTPSDVLSACIIPFLQIEIAICKGDLDYFSGFFNKIKEALIVYGSPFTTMYRGRHERQNDGPLPHGRAPAYLYLYRTKLRSWIEYFENQNGALLGLLSARFGPSITKGPFYLQIKEESLSITRQSSRLEAELRDYLQLEVSKLSLEESQKSIQVSNRQIDEAKRVKIFTVLAFFYVPLNLATSIFGMNLQQLNGSGTSIGAFLATAGIALFLTGIMWLLFERVQHVRMCFESDEPYTHNIAIRLYMIWWLSRNGFFKWMIRTGAGWCILIKSTRGFQPGEPGVEDMYGLKASKFISFIVQNKKYYMDVLRPGSGSWFHEPKRRASSIDRAYGD